jgi:hypothetical protein
MTIPRHSYEQRGIVAGLLQKQSSEAVVEGEFLYGELSVELFIGKKDVLLVQVLVESV